MLGRERRRIGRRFLQAGIGYGGSCFPKDVTALKQLAGNSGYHFQLLTAVIEVNALQKRRVVGKLRAHLGSLVGSQIAFLGLAFKPHTDDMREASALVLAARLQAEGATVRAYDPVAGEQARPLLRGVELHDTALDAIDGADAIVLITEWPEFAHLDWSVVAERMRGRTVVDGRNARDPPTIAAAGLVYEGIGRHAPSGRSLAGQRTIGAAVSRSDNAARSGIPSPADGSALYHHHELNHAPPNTESGRRLARR